MFPDAGTCQVRQCGTYAIHECLGRWAAECPHLILFEQKRFCHHPDAVSGGIQQVPETGERFDLGTNG